VSPPELGWAIPPLTFDTMVRVAEEDYPRETCGLVFIRPGEGRTRMADQDLEVVPIPNIQDRLHAADPETHPRDARTAYTMDPQLMAEAISRRESDGASLVAIYHSHPDHDAYFSKKDREDAVPPEWGEPIYQAFYLVFSVYGGRLQAVKGFFWVDDGGKRDFAEVDVTRGK
jgi:[CysO sulfur-carrier protein]-S-L-cysteine hydrolase